MTFARYPSLEGRVVLISGGGSGIGAEMVRQFAAQGAKVAFLELEAEAAEATANRVAEETGNRPLVEIVDLRDVAATRGAAARVAETLGPVRVLVNNAARDDRHAYDTVEPDYWDDRMATNLRHQFFLAQAVAPGMAAASGGSIVNLGSISWMFGAPGMICYTTAKSAVEGLTKSLAREIGRAGIRVNAIAPGWVLTERQVTRDRREGARAISAFLDRQCLKEHLYPPDIARMALWLAAEDSRLVTGQTFVVDGGVV